MKRIHLFTICMITLVGFMCGCSNDDDFSSKEQLNNHEYVDLNLPSGTLWAKTNIGASNETDYGLYFAWGETVGYSGDASNGRIFDWYNYKWMTPDEADWKHCTKYTYADNNYDACWYNGHTYVGSTVDGITYKNLTELETADDAASQNWGIQWRTPSEDQLQELIENTTSKWTTINGVNGRTFTSKTDSTKYIFLPAAGNQHPYGMGEIGYYWTRNLSSYMSSYDNKGRTRSAQNLWFDSKTITYSGIAFAGDCSSERCLGFSIRPVCMK